jgi:hypothetical protein
MLFLLSFYFRISYSAIFTVAINDNNHQHTFVAFSIFANIILAHERPVNSWRLTEVRALITGNGVRVVGHHK